MTVTVASLTSRVHRVPLPEPEADGTLAWDATTVVTVTAATGEQEGLGWTYGPSGIATVVDDLLAPAVVGTDGHDPGLAHLRMRRATRNAPTAGLASLAISAVDVALWDLKAKLLDVPLTVLFGQIEHGIPVYGSGGFTTMTDTQLGAQLAGWAGDDIAAVKIKIGEDRGRNVERDLHRITLARGAVGPRVQLMVDANGGYDTKQALRVAREVEDNGVVWFEEPVSSDRLADLAMLRRMSTLDIAAGEYGTTTAYFRHMCEARAVDCLQVDASRCGGYTGLFAAAAVADAYGLSVSTHCAPHLHAPAAAAIGNLRHAEWFADHVYVDRELFDGLPCLADGRLNPATGRPGHGMTLRRTA